MSDWYAVGPGGACPKCGDERLVHQIANPHGVEIVCDCCSYHFKVSGPLTATEYKQRFQNRILDCQGNLIDGP